jgi:hypothetical protein
VNFERFVANNLVTESSNLDQLSSLSSSFKIAVGQNPWAGVKLPQAVILIFFAEIPIISQTNSRSKEQIR